MSKNKNKKQAAAAQINNALTAEKVDFVEIDDSEFNNLDEVVKSTTATGLSSVLAKKLLAEIDSTDTKTVIKTVPQLCDMVSIVVDFNTTTYKKSNMHSAITTINGACNQLFKKHGVVVDIRQKTRPHLLFGGRIYRFSITV